MPDTAIYRAYSLGETEETCRAKFVEQYGVEPDICELLTFPTLIGGGKVPWGYWRVGPLPENKGKVNYGDLPKSDL